MISSAKMLQKILTEAGFKTLAAGGFVRDHLLGRQVFDIDFATEALPEQVKQILTSKNVETFDTGLKHGTITAVLNKINFEITTLRADRNCYGREAEVEFIRSFEEDAKRRDFSINGLFMDLMTGEIFDYVGGQADLKNKKLSYIGNPEIRVREDFLRILRFYRFKSVLGFKGDEKSETISDKFIPYLAYMSQERIREEILKLLVGQNVGNVLYENRKLIFFVFPELVPCYDFKQNCYYHIYDVYTHMCKGVEWLVTFKDPILSLAHLFHDIAKPFCHSTDEKGADHFYGHEIEGEKIVANMCHRLKMAKKETERIKFLVREHMSLHNLMNQKGYRRLINRCHKFSPAIVRDLLKIYEADCMGMSEEKIKTIAKTKEVFLENINDFYAKKEFIEPLTGQEIIDLFHIPAGKKIGLIKEFLQQKVLDGELNPTDKQAAISAVKSYVKSDLLS